MNSQVAYELKTSFINKNSETLLADFRSFITHYLGLAILYTGIKVEARSQSQNL